jgi:5-methylcytosine-specific restriction endonuclease McrA
MSGADWSSNEGKRARYMALGANRARHGNERFCVRCRHVSYQVEVDHIIPREVAPGRIFSQTNLQVLCVPCHQKKTAEDRVRWAIK